MSKKEWTKKHLNKVLAKRKSRSRHVQTENSINLTEMSQVGQIRCERSADSYCPSLVRPMEMSE